VGGLRGDTGVRLDSLQHKLYGAVHDKVGLLMTLDVDQAVALLVDQLHMVPPTAVVAQLRAESAAGGGGGSGGDAVKEKGAECNMRYYLHRYLDALFSADPTQGGEFHALQVRASFSVLPWARVSFILVETMKHHTIEDVEGTGRSRRL
jgi:hypothetical protein